MIAENKIYRLEEMKDAMNESIANADKVKSQQEKLVKILEKANDEDFKDLIEGEKKQIESLESQIKIMNMRLKNIENVLDNCKQDSAIATTINEFIAAVGMFE